MDELQAEVSAHEQIERIDNIVDKFIDEHNRQDPRVALPAGLKEIAAVVGASSVFFYYQNPRTFNKGEERSHTLVLSEGISEGVDKIIEQMIQEYKKHEIDEYNVETTPLTDEADGKNLLAIPVFGGHRKEYVGVIGLLKENRPVELDKRLLTQAASRLDMYIREKILQSERHRIMRKSAQALGKPGLGGIGEALRHIAEFTEVPKGIVTYLEKEIDVDVPPEERSVDAVWLENGEIAEKTEQHSKLNKGPGGSLIAYPRKQIIDSISGSRTIGIIERDSETGKETILNHSCQDLTSVPKDPDHTIGKLILIGGEALRQADLDLAETVALQMFNKISYVHEQKKTLSRSLHHEQVDFFIRKPEIAEWFFKNPREEIIGMVFTDICGYTAITRELNNPKKTIEGAREWILKEKELMHKFGGYFDKEVGDCAIALFGPPFCGISLEALNSIKSINELEELVARSQSEPHVYAYNSVLYALESVEAVKKFYMGEKQLNISVGIEVGKIALGDLTGVIGKLTAMGDSMNLSARLQGLAGHGEILIGPQCNEYLEQYKKEAWMGKLPFIKESAGEHKLKGYESPVPVFRVHR